MISQVLPGNDRAVPLELIQPGMDSGLADHAPSSILVRLKRRGMAYRAPSLSIFGRYSTFAPGLQIQRTLRFESYM